MNIPELAKAFFVTIEKRIGPFDRPIQFRPFPFDAGGALNFLTVHARDDNFVTYVSWDLFGHPAQKRGCLGRFELMTTCDNEEWVVEIMTRIGRESLRVLLEPGDTLDIGPWVEPTAAIQGIIFEEALSAQLPSGLNQEQCGLLGCIGLTRPELEFAIKKGTSLLVERLKRGHVYPHTELSRASVDLN